MCVCAHTVQWAHGKSGLAPLPAQGSAGMGRAPLWLAIVWWLLHSDQAPTQTSTACDTERLSHQVGGLTGTSLSEGATEHSPLPSTPPLNATRTSAARLVSEGIRV